MDRTTVVIVTVALIAAAVGTFPAAQGTAIAPGTGSDASAQFAGSQTTTPNESVGAPGERFAGVIGVQEAEFAGEIDRRAFGIRIAEAATADAKATVVAQQFSTIQERFDRLEQRKRHLQQARENGTVSEGRYRAAMAQLVVRTRTVERLAYDSEASARDLPPRARRRAGIDVTAIRRLGGTAENLIGPEVAAVARSIAGPDGGRSPDLGPSREAGSTAGNATDPTGASNRGLGPPDGATESDTQEHSSSAAPGNASDGRSRGGPPGWGDGS